MVYKSGQIFLPFCHNPRVWRTDGRTDRQTDGQTIFSSLDRVCIACSVVKNDKLNVPSVKATRTMCKQIYLQFWTQKQQCYVIIKIIRIFITCT